MDAGWPKYDQPLASGGTTEQAAAAALGYLGYSGTYSVDESTGEIQPRANGFPAAELARANPGAAQPIRW
jgi:hypothetical protein